MSLDGVELNYVESLSEALEFMQWLEQPRSVLGFDTESGGLRWWDHELRLVQFGDANTGWVISYKDWRGVIAQALASYDRPIVAHNLAFDAKFCLREGLTVKRHLWHDTLIMHHLLDPPATHALKPLSEELIDPQAHAGAVALHEGMRKQGWGWDTVPLDFAPYIWYSALDGVLVARMYDILWPQIQARGFEPNYELELGSVWSTGVDAAMRGMLIDVEYAQEARAFVRRRAAETKEAALVQYGDRVPGFSLGSSAHVTQILAEDGVQLTAKTASGAWKLDKAVLAELAGKHPLVDMVTQYRNDIKFARAYYGNVLDRVTPEGRLYADLRTLGARTGRMSVSEPPLQQIPSKDWRPRRMFVPKPGHVLISGDLSNIEVRLLAHYSQDPTMLEAFRRGEDVHMFMARKMYPGLPEDPNDPVCKKARKKSKSGSLGKQYGIGVAKFAEQQGVTEDEARAFLEDYDRTFPGVQQFVDDVEQIASKRFQEEGLAYIKDPSGRVHTLKDFEARDGRYYALVNFISQGWAATLLKKAINRFAATEYGQYYVLPVHDEFLCEVPEDLVEEVSAVMRECLTGCDDGKLTVPLECDIEIYRESWAESVEGFTTDMAPRKVMA